MIQYARIIRLWFENIKLNQSDYVSIIRFKTGHGKYPPHLYKINIIYNPICLCDKDIGTLNHIIFGCIKNTLTSEILIKNLIKNRMQLPTNTVMVLISNR